ncbi:MAG: hypothetical protein LLF75_07115 [Eubacteriales bacterium]|nr:hypothetical protein [Eubacteriales bacterium]
MQKTTAGVDRQATILLDMTFWSNMVVIVLLIIVNTINMIRAGSNTEPLISMASPELVLIASLALCVWMAFAGGSALATKRRLSRVHISCSEDGVEGVSMPNPANGDSGEAFSLSYHAIRFVGVVEVPITKKHMVPSLGMKDDQRSYIVPAPENLQELVRSLTERMTAL